MGLGIGLGALDMGDENSTVRNTAKISALKLDTKPRKTLRIFMMSIMVQVSKYSDMERR